jgi:hypothetical protein
MEPSMLRLRVPSASCQAAHLHLCCLPPPLALQLESDPDDKAREEALAKEFAGVTDFLKKSLGERVEKVVVSNRWVGAGSQGMQHIAGYL